MVKYSKSELEMVRSRIREFFPFLGDYTMRESGIEFSENSIKIGVEAGTNIDDFAQCLMEELDLVGISSDIFNIYEYDESRDVDY